MEKTITKYTNEYFNVIEDKSLGLLKLDFIVKPDKEYRDVLKRNGFKLQPNGSIWQRQLNENAKLSIERIIKEFDKLDEEAHILYFDEKEGRWKHKLYKDGTDKR